MRGRWRACDRAFSTAPLTRLVDPDTILKSKIVEFVSRGDFGLASGEKADGSYERVWFEEMIASDEVAFDAGVFLLRKARASALNSRKRGRSRNGASPDLAGTRARRNRAG